jgi:hypothetical protein
VGALLWVPESCPFEVSSKILNVIERSVSAPDDVLL